MFVVKLNQRVMLNSLSFLNAYYYVVFGTLNRVTIYSFIYPLVFVFDRLLVALVRVPLEYPHIFLRMLHFSSRNIAFDFFRNAFVPLFIGYSKYRPLFLSACVSI